MRPLKLQIEGFTAFKDEVCLDFSQLDLFAITGPTGAGKSSLIDAIAYALYGRIPRVSTEVASCISLDLDRMLVGLEFMAGEEKYRLFRETRRKGAGNVRLERWREDGWQAVDDRARQVNERVAEIVGLDYDGFTRSVILPQGQFQEFLAGSSEKRRAVLASLLRLQVYESMRKRASGMAAEQKTRIEERERSLAALAEATPENVRRLEDELASTTERLEASSAELTAFQTAVTLAAALNQARGVLGRCETEAQQALAEYEKNRRLFDEGGEMLTTLDAEGAALQARLDANCYDAERHQALAVALERVKAVVELEASIGQAQRLHDDAAKQLAGATAAVEKHQKAHNGAEVALVEAEAARSEAQRHNLVAAVQQGLKAGDPCPVCNGKIGVLVAVDGGDLDAASKRYELARKAEGEARVSLGNATNVATRLTANVENAEQQLAGLTSRLAAARATALEVLTEGQDASPAAVQAALAEQIEARRERVDLEARLRDTLARRESVWKQREDAERRLAALEQRTQTAADALEAASQAAEAAGRALEAAVSGWPDVSAVAGRGADAEVVLRRHQAEAQERYESLVRSIGQLEVRIEHLKADVERANELRAGLTALKQEWNVSADLAQMLGATKFQTYVQQEAMRTLAAHGSQRLEQLSGGRYKLQLDERGAEFEVVDLWNADLTRSVKTLSGGETFLASLALSLALAESLPSLAAGRRVVLDSIFLDEGFGSLDAEALDRAADALDALRLENRMVCIVTHLPELAQRLPARIVVTKTEGGSTAAVA